MLVNLSVSLQDVAAPQEAEEGPGGRVPPLPADPVLGQCPTGVQLLELLCLRPGMAGAPHSMIDIRRYFSLPSHNIIMSERTRALNDFYCIGFAKEFASVSYCLRQNRGLDIQWAVIATMILMELDVDEETERWVYQRCGLESMSIDYFYRRPLRD